jgi:hypothetical protein
VFALGTASTASAAFVAYPDRASWASAAGTPTGAENFNDFTEDTDVGLTPVPIQGGSLSTSFDDDRPRTFIDVAPFQANSDYVVDGTPVLQVAVGYLPLVPGNHPLNFNFATPVKAWAVDVRRHQTGGVFFPDHTVHIEAYNGANSLVGSILLERNFQPSALEFYGFTTDAAVSRVAFVFGNSLPISSTVFGLDNTAFVAIPEPAALLTAAWGVLALGVFRRR